MSNATFEAKSKRLLAVHPDAAQTLNAATNDGLTLSPEAVHEITRLGAPEVAYFLARPENREYALKMHGMKPHAQVVEVGKIAKDLAESGQGFDPETDSYLKESSPAMAKREGRRRR
jgi:hypothetical protein